MTFGKETPCESRSECEKLTGGKKNETRRKLEECGENIYDEDNNNKKTTKKRNKISSYTMT